MDEGQVPSGAGGAMRLYWSSRSPFVRKVMVVAHELGVADLLVLERVNVGIVRLSDAVMAENPINKIPTLVTPDQGPLFDSPVICEYLDAWSGRPQLFPHGPARWSALRMQALGDGIMDLLTLRLFENARPEPTRWSEVHEAARTKLAAGFDYAEKQIGAVQASDALHIGHVALACALAHHDFRFSEDNWRRGRPALTAWFESISARSSMRATEYENVY